MTLIIQILSLSFDFHLHKIVNIMRTLLLIMILAHGLLHVLGFVKAFKLADLPQLTRPISRTNGVLWLVAAILFIVCGILFYVYHESWWMVGIASVIISEYVIIRDWEDAGLGTTLNITILVIAVIGCVLWFLGYY